MREASIAHSPVLHYFVHNTLHASLLIFFNVSLRRPCSLQDFCIICQQIGRKSASRGVGKKGLWDEAIHADLIRRLHNMEQVSQQHTVHIHTLNSNMPHKSHSQTPSLFVICQVPI
mgnify:CR=1 FL=1